MATNYLYDLQKAYPNTSTSVQLQTQQKQGTGIRDALRSQYGINNSDIGYQNGWVTVKGQNLVKPDWIDDSGTSYVSDGAKLQKAVSAMYAGGDTGIRAAGSEYGLDASKFGMSNGVVTYNGQNFITPERVQNGVSYTSRDNMTNAVVNYYKNNGKNVVKATDYLANSGYPFQINYNNGMLSVDGQTIKPLFVENGSAYVDSAELDKAVAAAREQSGIQNRNAIVSEYEKKYQPYYDKLLDALTNRKKFSYDIESDPVYGSYQAQYEREGDRAMRDALASYSTATGGYANSAAATAANAQRGYWADKLMDRIPELEAQAYQRYLNDFNMNQSELSSVMGLDNQQFERAYGANSDAIADVQYNNQLAEQRRQYLDNRADIAYERRLDSQLDPYTVEAARLDNETANHQAYGLAQQNQSAEFTNLLNQSLYYGDWVDYDWARRFGIDPEKTKPRDYEQWQAQNAADIEYNDYARRLALQNAYSAPTVRTSSGGSRSSSASSGSGSAKSSGSGTGVSASTSTQTKPKLTLSQTEKAIENNNITPEVMAAYQYYYGVPYGSKISVTTAIDENGNEYKKLYVQ